MQGGNSVAGNVKYTFCAGCGVTYFPLIVKFLYACTRAGKPCPEAIIAGSFLQEG